MVFGTFVPIASASAWFLQPPSPASSQQASSNYVRKSVEVAQLVPEASPAGQPSATTSRGWTLPNGLSFLDGVVPALRAWVGALTGLFTATADALGRMVAPAGLTNPGPSTTGTPEPDTALQQGQSSSGGIPPNSTAGYVEDTLVLYNNTLLPGNVPNVQANSATPPPVTPSSVAVDPSNGMIFVAAVTGGSNTTVFEISPSTDRIVKSITVLPPADTQCGFYAPASAFDPTNGYLYLTSSSCPTPVVVVLDANNGTILKQIPLPSGFGANALAFDSANSEVYVTGVSGSTESVEVINATSDSLLTAISLGGCWAFAPLFDSNDSLMYVTVWYCGSNVALRHEDLYGINATNAVVARIPIPNDDVLVAGAGTAGITLSGIIYIEGGSNGYGGIAYPIDVVDPQTNTTSVITVPCGLKYGSNTCYPVGLTFDRSNGYLYAASSLGPGGIGPVSNVSTINPSTGAVVGSIVTGYGEPALVLEESSGGLHGLAFDQSDGRLYAVNPRSGTVSVIFDMRFNATFTETGLPSGDTWGTVVAGTTPKYTSSATITYSAPNGVYQLNVTAAGGYCASPPSRVFTVNGTDVAQTIQFTSSCDNLTFTETGLPLGERWGVSLNGFLPQSATATSVSFAEPSGNYTYTVSPNNFSLLGDIQYCVTGGFGTADVNSTSVSVAESFYICGGYANVSVQTNKDFYSGIQTVSLNGTVFPAIASQVQANFTTQAVIGVANPLNVLLLSLTVNVTANTGAFSLNFTTGGSGWIGGTYTVSVSWPSGPGCGDQDVPSYDCLFTSGTAQFGYLPSGPTYQVSFVEAGLPQGTAWAVTFVNVTKSSTSSTIDYSFPDGFYPYTIPDAGAYVAQIPPSRQQMALVNGSGLTEDIGFVYSEQVLLDNGTMYQGPLLSSGFGTNEVSSLAYDPVNGMLYSLLASNSILGVNAILGVNETTGRVSQEFSVYGTISTLTVDPLSGDLFVTNSSVLPNTNYLAFTVTVIDPTKGAVVAVAPLLPHPSAAEQIETVSAAGFASSTDTLYALAQIINSSDAYQRQVVYAVSGTTGAVESNFTVSSNRTDRRFFYMAVDPVRGTVYLGGYFFSTSSGLAILAVKPSPWTVVSNTTNGFPYGLDSISYDSRNGLAYLALGDYSYGCRSSGGLYSFNANTSAVAEVSNIGCAAGVAFNPENGDLYVSSPTFGVPGLTGYGMSVVDPTTGAVVANITTVAREPESAVDAITAVNMANGDVYAASLGSYAISVVSGSSNTVVSEIFLGAAPGSMAYASDGLVFVADQGTNTLWVLNATTGQVERNVPIPTTSIGGMAYDPTNGYLYVVDRGCSPNNQVIVFDTKNDTVVSAVALNANGCLWSATFDPVSNRVFVTDLLLHGYVAFVFDASTDRLVGNISLGAQQSATGAIAYDPVTGYVYALGGSKYILVGPYYNEVGGSDQLYAINGSTDAIVANSTVPLSDAMAVDSKTGMIYTIGGGSTFELAAVNATTGSVNSVTPVPCSSSSNPYPNQVACGTMTAVYDPANGEVYIAVTMGGSPILASYDTLTGAAGVLYDGATAVYRLFYGEGTVGQQTVLYDPMTNELFTSAGYVGYYSTIGAISIVRPLNASFVSTVGASLQVSAYLPDGSPVPGVSVSVAGLGFTTGGAGTLTFTGLSAGASESVQACVAGLCSTKSVTLAAGSNALSFEIQGVEVSVTDPQGGPVAGVQLTYSGTGGVSGLFTTGSSGYTPSVLAPANATLSVSTSLYGTGLPYETPPTETFTVNGTNPVIRLQPLPTGTLQGVVAYSNGTLVAGARVTLSEQVNGATFTGRVSADSTGGYSTTFYAGTVTAFAVSPLYLSSPPEYASIPQNGTATLNFTIPLTGPGYINLQLFTQYLGGQLEGPLPVDWRVGAHYGIHAEDAQGNQYTVLGTYLPSGQLMENVISVPGNAGERFTVCANGAPANLPSECVPVTLNAYRNATAVIELIQPGALNGTVVDAATGTPVSSWQADVYRLNATGYASYVTAVVNYNSSLYYGVPQLGEYRLDVFSYVGSDELWGQATVNASLSQVYQLGNVSLFMGAGDLFAGKAGNTLGAVPGQSAPGGTLFLRATYSYTGALELYNVSMLVPVPAGASAVAGGFLLDGKPISPSPSAAGYYSVPLGNLSSGASGEVRYELQIADDYNGSSLALLALIKYDTGGRGYEEALSSAVETVEQVTLSAPLSLSTLNTTVSGQAPPGSTLEVFSNDTLVGTAAVPAGGYWETGITLPSAGNQTTYQVHAVAITKAGLALYSPVSTVVYDNTEPQLVRVCMEQTDGRPMCWDPQEGIPHFPYVFVPGMPMTFTLSFSHAALVGDVSVSVPGVGTVNATLDQDGLYRATMVPYAFGDVYVSYNVLRIPKGNGATLPFPTAAQILSGLPPGLIDHANYTVLANTTTSFDLLINVPSNMSYVFGGTSLEVSAAFTPNVLYTLTAGDIRNLTETGYPVYNITSGTTVTSNGTSYNSSFFVPYSALPPAIVKELDQPMSTCSNCPSVGGEGINIGIKVIEKAAPDLLKEGAPLGRAIPFAGAGFSAWGWFEDHEWVELQDAKLQQLTSCASSAPGAFASQSQSFINEANKYSATVSGLGHTAEANDVAGGVLSFVPLAGSESGMLSGGLSIAYSSGESQLSAKISAAISNCEKELHSAPPGSDTANVNPIEDPSGVVYAGLLSNPVANATVTVFQFNSTTSQWMPWSASGYGQSNPLQTDPEGRYAWFVPAGKYMVVVQAPGYSTARSIVVYVPPPATGVDVDMPPLTSPSVSGVSAFSNSTGSYIELSFDQLMTASSLNGTTITVSSPGGQSVAGRVVPVDPQTAPDGYALSSEAVFVPDAPLTAGVNYTVDVAGAVQNYAKMSMSSSTYSQAVSLAARNYSLATTALDVGAGGAVSATAGTNDPLSKYVQFTWMAPGNESVASTTVALTASGATASFTPDESGTWVVQASFTDGTDVIRTLSHTFYVVQPAPLTEQSATVTTNSSGDASFNSALVNGVGVTITGSAPGVGLSVNTFDYQAAPPGTVDLGSQTGATAIGYYFDVSVTGTAGAGTTATVCFSGGGVASSDLLYYYNSTSEGEWVEASGISFQPPDTVCGSVGVSDLQGTPLVAAQPPASPPPPPPTFGFSVGVTPSSASVTQGGTAAATVSLSLTSGTAQPVTLSAAGLPQGASAPFSPSSCTPGCSSTMTITTSSDTPPGTYSVILTASGGGQTESAAFTLTVTATTTTTTTTTTTSTTTSATTTTTTTTTSTTTSASTTKTSTTTTSSTAPQPTTTSTPSTSSTTAAPPPPPPAISYTTAILASIVAVVVIASAALLIARKRASYR